MTHSPLFHKHGEVGHSLRVHYTPANDTYIECNPVNPFKVPGWKEGDPVPVLTAKVSTRPKLGLQIVPIHFDDEDSRIVNSVDEAERYLISIVDPLPITIGSLPGPRFLGDRVSPFIYICRQGNLIAARTRRRAGNVVMVNEFTLEKFKLEPGGALQLLKDQEQTTKGAWTKKAIINNYMDVYVSDRMKDGEVFVTAIGPDSSLVDGPAALLEHNQVMKLFIIRNIETSIGNAQDYMSKIQFTFE